MRFTKTTEAICISISDFMNKIYTQLKWQFSMKFIVRNVIKEFLNKWADVQTPMSLDCMYALYVTGAVYSTTASVF